MQDLLEDGGIISQVLCDPPFGVTKLKGELISLGWVSRARIVMMIFLREKEAGVRQASAFLCSAIAQRRLADAHGFQYPKIFQSRCGLESHTVIRPRRFRPISEWHWGGGDRAKRGVDEVTGNLF